MRTAPAAPAGPKLQLPDRHSARPPDKAAHRPRLVIAGVASGVGKTTVTLGLLAALRRRGLTVQAFKVGPDYIDPGFHAAVTGRPARNLDSWMMGEDGVREVYWRTSADADISVIEGMMGLFDGRDPHSDEASTAAISAILAAPVVLVMDVSRMARSAAAVVHGFQTFAPSVRIAGVIANFAGGPGHIDLVRAAVEDRCGVPVLGGLAHRTELVLPERHLGLVPAEAGETHCARWAAFADAVEDGIDVDALLAVAQAAPPVAAPEPKLFAGAPHAGRAVIAVARDAAFHFYYPENLELLAWYGARLRYFSPLAGEPVPDDADGVYIGGGFPEAYSGRLAEAAATAASVRACAAAGMPILAECGGFMYLARELVTQDGTAYPMAGVLPFRVRMQERLAAIGYREAVAVCDNFMLRRGERIRGHEFHYSTAEFQPWPRQAAPQPAGMAPGDVAAAAAGGPAYAFGDRTDGWVAGNVMAGYMHVHFASHPMAARRFVDACATYRARRRAVASGMQAQPEEGDGSDAPERR
ncbi:cobyrinic acid a,c-diamide synthase [Alicyclobacillus cellulosilyticus]|uniref:Cobyrinate a,c-diamide synthase n=1 Tax=Alicyclobacillus cellulosilyticus TaxID=1003997 RepID=A0A917KH68_9BACL|nr:cobyrinate a,c-diamide synthase [Alicyclobacillus cellulosilyticus]GGJ13191.1 cobyrinic acid a,c-diamide synthase [Alicyclobacillus cellulosilyticus]